MSAADYYNKDHKNGPTWSNAGKEAQALYVEKMKAWEAEFKVSAQRAPLTGSPRRLVAQQLTRSGQVLEEQWCNAHASEAPAYLQKKEDEANRRKRQKKAPAAAAAAPAPGPVAAPLVLVPKTRAKAAPILESSDEDEDDVPAPAPGPAAAPAPPASLGASDEDRKLALQHMLIAAQRAIEAAQSMFKSL